MNCVVQCLFSLPLFRTYLLRRVHSNKHKSGVIQSRKDCFLCELENACLRYMELPYPTSLAWISDNVSSLTKSLTLGMQEDAHEFLIAVLSCMEREATEAGGPRRVGHRTDVRGLDVQVDRVSPVLQDKRQVREVSRAQP